MRYAKVISHALADHMAPDDHELSPAHETAEKMPAVKSVAGRDKRDMGLAADEERNERRDAASGVKDLDLFKRHDLGERAYRSDDRENGFLMDRQRIVRHAGGGQIAHQRPSGRDDHRFMAFLMQVFREVHGAAFHTAGLKL